MIGWRAGVRVGGKVLLEQPGLEVIDRLGGAVLALVEGDEVGLMVRMEQQVKGGCGVGQPLAAEFADALVAALAGFVHGGSSS